MNTTDNASMSRDHRQVAAPPHAAEAAHQAPVTSAPPPPPPPARVTHPASPPAPPQTHLARVMTAVGTVSKTADLLQLVAQVQIILSNKYYRARHALAALTTKHTAEVQALLRIQNAESQTLRHRHEEAMRVLLERHEQVEDEMKRELTQLLAALETTGNTRATGQAEVGVELSGSCHQAQVLAAASAYGLTESFSQRCPLQNA